MKRIYKRLIAMLLLVALLCLNSCSMFMPPDQKFDGGELLDSEKLSEIRSNVFSSEMPESNIEEMTDDTNENLSEAMTEISETDTETVINETETEETETEETETEEKDPAQSSETPEVKTDITESDDDREETRGQTVFWIAGGEVWHLSRDCRYIKNKDFISGTVEDAIAAHKTRVCSSCGK